MQTFKRTCLRDYIFERSDGSGLLYKIKLEKGKNILLQK
jgi:hypothetical protein